MERLPVISNPWCYVDYAPQAVEFAPVLTVDCTVATTHGPGEAYASPDSATAREARRHGAEYLSTYDGSMGWDPGESDNNPENQEEY